MENYLRQIKESMSHGDLRKALALCKEALRQDAQEPLLWGWEARLRVAVKEYDTAAFAVEQAISLERSVETLLLQSWFLRTQGNLDEARDWVSEAKDLVETETEEIAVLLGEAQTLFAELQSEINELVRERAEEEEEIPEVMQVPEEIVEIFEDGLEVLEDILQIDPKAPEALALKADFLSLMNRPDEAAKARKKALKSRPKETKWLYEQAQDLERAEEAAEALAVYRQLYELEAEAIAACESPLYFEVEEFAKQTQEVWTEIEEALREEGVGIAFAIHHAIFPEAEMMEESIPEAIFDPFTAFHIDVQPQAHGKEKVVITLFQRNIERMWREEGDVELSDFLGDILADAVEPAIYLLEGDDGEEDEL